MFREEQEEIVNNDDIFYSIIKSSRKIKRCIGETNSFSSSFFLLLFFRHDSNIRSWLPRGRFDLREDRPAKDRGRDSTTTLTTLDRRQTQNFRVTYQRIA